VEEAGTVGVGGAKGEECTVVVGLGEGEEAPLL
jgi:hypothetical protein